MPPCGLRLAAQHSGPCSRLLVARRGPRVRPSLGPGVTQNLSFVRRWPAGPALWQAPAESCPAARAPTSAWAGTCAGTAAAAGRRLPAALSEPGPRGHHGPWILSHRILRRRRLGASPGGGVGSSSAASCSSAASGSSTAIVGCALQAQLVLAAAPAQFAVQHLQPCIDDKPSDPLQLYTQCIHYCVEFAHIPYITV